MHAFGFGPGAANAMKTLYEASSAIEAHMLCDLLRQDGIVAHVQGEHLQSAIGELPAAGLVRLTVDEADFVKARALVERWDAAQPKEPAVRRPAPASRLLTGLLLGLALGIGGTYFFLHSPVTTDGVDHDGDGLLDEKWTYSPSGAVRAYEVDRNLDKKADYVTRYDHRGLMEQTETDDNFDGVFEGRMRFRANNVETTEIDTDGDTYPDLRSRFVDGILATTEFINPSTGHPLRVESFKLGKMTHADVDTDKDGRLDKRIRYTPLGEASGTETLAK
jgi:hypothetical protein